MIIKKSEEVELGMIIEALILNKKEKELAVAFVDNTDFVTSGEECQNKMQSILDQYSAMYAATGGYIEDSKTYFYSWQWKWSKGSKVIKAKTGQLKINMNQIQQKSTNENTRSLCVHISLKLNWKI